MPAPRGLLPHHAYYRPLQGEADLKLAANVAHGALLEQVEEFDQDAIEADEIINDEIPDEFLMFLGRHWEQTTAACIQCDYGRGSWQTLKQRVRVSRDRQQQVTMPVDEGATRIAQALEKNDSLTSANIWIDLLVSVKFGAYALKLIETEQSSLQT